MEWNKVSEKEIPFGEDDYYKCIPDIISALEIRYKQFALPNMPTH